VLRRHAIPASFFFTGDFYRDLAQSALIHALRADGHYLGAHSDRHLLYAAWENRDSLLVSREEFRQDLADNYRALEAFDIRREDAPVFLPPYEWYNDSIAVWTRAEGLTLINYTPGTSSHADYTTPLMGARYLSTDSIFARILRYEQLAPAGLNGFILLLHIGTHSDRTDKFYHRLDELLSVLKGRGYGFMRFAAVRPTPPER
jgi:peptidoglycan/xylan/chitin deacetylase (PgdA/CDA1 family)